MALTPRYVLNHLNPPMTGKVYSSVVTITAEVTSGAGATKAT